MPDREQTLPTCSCCGRRSCQDDRCQRLITDFERDAPNLVEHLTVGGVVAALKEDFPEVTISKLQFFDKQGVCKPSRTPGGYRIYSLGQVNYLRMALALQKFCYTPLADIPETIRMLVDGDTYKCPFPGCDGHIDVAQHPAVRYGLKVQPLQGEDNA